MVARLETRLKRILIDEGRSQAWLARQVGCGRSQINSYCQGIFEPQLLTKQAIADALGRNVADVFPGHEAERSHTDPSPDSSVGDVAA